MTRNLCIVVALGALAGGAVYSNTYATVAAEKHAFTPDDIPFGPAPNFVRKGAQLAVLEGDPLASSGDYTVRLKMPPGYRIAPHWHPERENVTVISGILKLGMGDHFREAGMKCLPTGSFGFLDPNMHHYVLAEGETIVQIHGKSPVQFNYVDPEDDPSRSQ
jgi:hypothetical protein